MRSDYDITSSINDFAVKFLRESLSIIPCITADLTSLATLLHSTCKCLSTVLTITNSVGTVLTFQFSPGFGSEASVPAVSRYWFWYLGSGSYLSIPGFRNKVFRGLFANAKFWYLLDPFRFQNNTSGQGVVSG